VTPRRGALPVKPASEEAGGQLLTRRLTLRPERPPRASRSGGPGQARSESVSHPGPVTDRRSEDAVLRCRRFRRRPALARHGGRGGLGCDCDGPGRVRVRAAESDGHGHRDRDWPGTAPWPGTGTVTIVPAAAGPGLGCRGALTAAAWNRGCPVTLPRRSLCG
jgi:hypothetical protein